MSSELPAQDVPRRSPLRVVLLCGLGLLLIGGAVYVRFYVLPPAPAGSPDGSSDSERHDRPPSTMAGLADDAPPLPPGLERTPAVGHGDSRFLDLAEDGRLLIGFRFTLKEVEYTTVFTSIQPVYAKGQERVESSVHGEPTSQSIAIEAEPGYAVSGLSVSSGTAGIESIQVEFMRSRGNSLDPTDKYLSRHFGSRTEAAPVKLAGDGRPVVGLHGFAPVSVGSLGLVVRK